MRKVCNFIIKYSIYALVLLMPLFWLSWTIEAYEFNKQYLLVFLIGLAFVAWLAKMVIVQKKIVFRRTPLDVWVLVFMAVTILAGIFSVDNISSWLGFYGRFSGSVIGLLSLCIMYFIITNNGQRIISNKNKQHTINLALDKPDSKKLFGLSLEKIINLFLFSSIIITITAYFSVFNVWSKIPGLPDIMSFRSFNPVSGSLEGLSIFLTAVIGLVVGILLIGIKNKKSEIKNKLNYIVYYGLVFSSLILLLLIDFKPAWIVLGIVMLILLLVCLWTRILREKVNLLILPIILLLVSVLGVYGVWTDFYAQAPNFIKVSLPQELILSHQITEDITWQSLKEYPVLGSGQGTFLTNFARFKPAEFNQSDFWNIRFDKASNHLMEMVGTTGILGILSYASLVFVFLLILFLFLLRVKSSRIKSSKRLWLLFFPLILAWLSLFVAQFVYLENTVLTFFFWLFMALIVVVWQKVQDKPFKKISFSFKELPEVGLVMNIILLILIFGLISLFYLGGRFYLAEIKFRQPVETSEQAVQNIEKAVNLNKYRENYRRSLSQAYLVSAWNEANKAQEEQNTQLLQAYASGAIQQARFAVTLAPESVAAWENLGIIYRDSSGLVGGTLPFALEAYANAVELEPTNPFFYRELCRLNLISEEKDWDKTIEHCQKAVDLKQDYLDAHIQLAMVYEQKGELEEALNQMKSVLDKLKGVSFQRGSDLAGAATEIYFQLGRLHFNLNHIEEAIAMFEQAVIITPQYANGRYALGLSYQVNGRNEDALIQFQIVDQLVPGNENIQTLIQQLTQPAQPVE